MSIFPKKEEPPVTPPPETKPAFDQEAMLTKMGELLGTKLSETVSPISQRLEALEQKFAKPKEEPKPTEIPSVMDDEDSAFNTRLGPVVTETVAMKARLIESEVLRELEGEYGDLIPKVREQLKGTDLVSKNGMMVKGVYESYIKNVADMVVGRAAREGGLKRKANSFVFEDSSGSGGRAEGTSGLGQEQRDFLDFSVTIPARNGRPSKKVTRADMLRDQGINIDDPKVLADVMKNYSSLQVIQ
jgi:hypothetical protein